MRTSLLLLLVLPLLADSTDPAERKAMHALLKASEQKEQRDAKFQQAANAAAAYCKSKDMVLSISPGQVGPHCNLPAPASPAAPAKADSSKPDKQ